MRKWLEQRGASATEQTFADGYFCLTHLLLLPLIFRTTYSESTSSGGAQLPLFRSMVDAGR